MANKIFVYLITLSLLSPQPALSSELIALADSKYYEAFKSYLNDNHRYTSYLDYSLSKKISFSDRLIEDKYRLAVKGLLLEDLKPSIYLFKELTSFRENKIFSEKSKGLLRKSFYRLANLEKNHSSFWLKKGFLFAPTTDPHIDDFNPKIISSYQAVKKENEAYLIPLSKNDLFKPEQTVFINGKKVDNIFYILAGQSYFLKIFQEGHKSLSLVLSGEEFLKKKRFYLSKNNFGTCQNPIFPSKGDLKNIDTIFFKKNCIRSRKESPQIQIKNPPLILSKFTPKKEKLDLVAAPTATKWYKKKSTWYIIGGSLLATAMAISFNEHQQSQNPQIKPVHY